MKELTKEEVDSLGIVTAGKVFNSKYLKIYCELDKIQVGGALQLTTGEYPMTLMSCSSINQYFKKRGTGKSFSWRLMPEKAGVYILRVK